MRSHSSLHASSPYSTSTPRTTSLSVAQARLHRLAEQDQLWSTPQSQGVANAFVGNGLVSNPVYGSPLDGNWTNDGSLAVSNYNYVSTPAPYDSVITSTISYGDGFTLPSASQDYSLSCSPLQHPPKSSGSYTSTDSYRSSPYSTVADSATFSNSYSSPSSQVSPFTHGAEIPPAEPNHALSSAQPQQLPSATQYQPGYDTGYHTSFDGAYRPSEAPASTYSTPAETSRVQSSYSDQHLYYPTRDDRRGSTASLLPDYQRSYHSNEPQNGSVDGQPSTQSTTAASESSHHGASPAAVHTPSPHQAPSQELPDPGVRAVGSTEAVSRRLGIMLHTQKCQQAEHTERAPIKSPSSHGRRDKLTPAISDVIEADEGMNSSAKYKAAYERVRLQRNFYERATSSLVHQVKMLGGDPMQASRRASKGEDLDLKRARILVASLQHELETLRNKLIQTQKELHSIRQSCDDSSRSLRRRVSSGNFLRDDDDKAPLSAAPVLVYTRSCRR